MKMRQSIQARVCEVTMVSWTRCVVVGLALAMSLHSRETLAESAAASPPLTMVVMDPLAAPLACDCVKGYANRQYQRLAEAIEAKLKTKVNVTWTESLVALSEKDPKVRPDLIIGKHSVVKAHGEQLELELRPFALLTDTEGKVTQRGLFVVRSSSELATVVDLDGATVFFGPEDCAEKWTSPRALLDKLEIATSPESKTFSSCSEAAKALLALPEDVPAAAIISSYAAPLLEGCGTIKKGDLRVIGQTDELPFVTAFVNAALPAEQQSAIESAILQQRDPELLKVLESAKGFQAFD